MKEAFAARWLKHQRNNLTKRNAVYNACALIPQWRSLDTVRLDLSRHTLRSWKRRDAGPTPAARGRPCSTSPPERRHEVAELLRELGPHAGLPRLRRAFPGVARSELAELQAVERRRYREQRAVHARRLQWQRPGMVWAMDYAEPPTPIDGVYQAVFSVRDLASGRQLA